tara:strand:- start:2925 stop:3542 length:618 start_codon:yes stop_codon:yes gene_type:complete
MRIGLVPMAAKPYHAGHHALVETAARENEEVLLYVSTSDRKRKGELPIHGADMQNIWTNQIEAILPGNVTPVYGGSPVRKVYDVLIDANEKALQGNLEHVYTVYSDPTDTARNYSPASIQKYFPEAHAAGAVKFAAEENPEAFTRGVGTPDVSGTSVREAIQCGDFETFESSMPKGIDTRAVYDQLCPVKSENYLRAYITEIIRG